MVVTAGMAVMVFQVPNVLWVPGVVMVVMIGTVGTEVLFNVGERGSCLMRRGRGCLTRPGSVLVDRVKKDVCW
jgi:hypothetical protein